METHHYPYLQLESKTQRNLHSCKWTYTPVYLLGQRQGGGWHSRQTMNRWVSIANDTKVDGILRSESCPTWRTRMLLEGCGRCVMLQKSSPFFFWLHWVFNGFSWWLRWQRICLQCGRPGFDPWVGQIPWRKAMMTHSSILTWRLHWAEEAGGLQSTGSQRVRHAWVNETWFSLLCIGLLANCNAWASHWGIFSCCGVDSGGAAYGLSCFMGCGLFLDQGWNPCPLPWQADS